MNPGAEKYILLQIHVQYSYIFSKSYFDDLIKQMYDKSESDALGNWSC